MNCLRRHTNWPSKRLYWEAAPGGEWYDKGTQENCSMECIVCVCVCVSCLVMSSSLGPHGLYPTRLFCPWNSQARILEWVAISCSRGISWPRDWTQISCIAGRFFSIWAIGKSSCDWIIECIIGMVKNINRWEENEKEFFSVKEIRE